MTLRYRSLVAGTAFTALQWTSMPRGGHVEDLGPWHCEKWLGPLSSQSLACTQSHSVRLALPSGWVATSRRRTSLRATRFFCPVSQCVPEVVKARQVARKELGSSMLFSANIAAVDPAETIARFSA
jgi:hypothetical protein